MPGHTKRVYFLAILLGVLLFGAQMHCCADFNSSVMGSHACPICSTVGTAITTPSLVMATLPAINRLELIRVSATAPVVVLRNVAPRAPPAY
jgi:hypothetical protein